MSYLCLSDAAVEYTQSVIHVLVQDLSAGFSLIAKMLEVTEKLGECVGSCIRTQRGFDQSPGTKRCFAESVSKV